MVSLRNFNPLFFRETKDGKIVLVSLDKGMYLLNDRDIILKNHEYFKVENNSTKRLNDSKARTALKILNEETDDLIKIKSMKDDKYDNGIFKITAGDTIQFYDSINISYLKNILGDRGSTRLSPSRHQLVYETTKGKGIINEAILRKPVTVDEATIIDLYKMFYKKIPDFDSKNIMTEVQEMAFLLQSFHIDSALYNYNFICTEKSHLLESFKIRCMVLSLKRLGAVNLYRTNTPKTYWRIEGTNDYPKDVRMDMMREVIDCEDFLDEIIKMNRVLYYEWHKQTSDINELSTHTSLSIDDVSKSLKYINTIRDNLK